MGGVMATEPIIIFDGVCNLCNSAVNFIIKRDSKAVFKFVPLQSKVAQELMLRHQVQELGTDTFILIKNGQCFVRTNAALEVAKDLDGFCFLFRVFKLVPTVIRDYFYNLLAKKRYSLFGNQEQCMVPSNEVRKRFLI